MSVATKPKKTPFLSWFRSLEIQVPDHVDPSPFSRQDLELDEVVSRDFGLGAYNVWRESTREQTREDFDFITTVVDVCCLSESRKRGKADDVKAALKPHGWGYYQGTISDTAIAWNQKRYRVFHRSSESITSTLWKRTIRMTNSLPLLGLEDRVTGERFYVISAHTQYKGYKLPWARPQMTKQYREINRKVTRLNKEGHAVFVAGDLNNPRALEFKVVPPRFRAIARKGGGIDYVCFDPRRVLKKAGGAFKGIGFDHKRDKGDGRMHSDHPFVWGRFRLKPAAAAA